jgi:hypothetical protein
LTNEIVPRVEIPHLEGVLSNRRSADEEDARGLDESTRTASSMSAGDRIERFISGETLDSIKDVTVKDEQEALIKTEDEHDVPSEDVHEVI